MFQLNVYFWRIQRSNAIRYFEVDSSSLRSPRQGVSIVLTSARHQMHFCQWRGVPKVYIIESSRVPSKERHQLPNNQTFKFACQFNTSVRKTDDLSQLPTQQVSQDIHGFLWLFSNYFIGQIVAVVGHTNQIKAYALIDDVESPFQF